MKSLGLIAGKGIYPRLIIENARRNGVEKIVLAAFEGETSPDLVSMCDAHQWMRVGQLGRLIRHFNEHKIDHAIMAGQITPARLYDLRPDFKAFLTLLKLKKRNAESLFGAVADAMQEKGIHLLPATTFIEHLLAPEGHIAGPRENRSLLKDASFGWPIAKQISAMDIGQTIVVKKGTVLAVEGFDGTNATLRRGGNLGKGGAVAIKVSKPRQDFRFDVPVIGPDTLHVAHESGLRAIVCEAKKTLLLELEQLTELARKYRLTILGMKTDL